MKNLTNEEVKNLIVDLRGTPTKCDFCGKEYPEEDLHPEEAGQWICIECIKKLGY